MYATKENDSIRNHLFLFYPVTVKSVHVIKPNIDIPPPYSRMIKLILKGNLML